MQGIPTPLPAEFHAISDQILNGLIGCGYTHLGRDPQYGLDCIGLKIVYFKTLGLPVVVPKEADFYPVDYWRDGASQLYLSVLDDQFCPIPERCVQAGDIVVFSVKDRHNLSHTGIIKSGVSKAFVHALDGRGVISGNLKEKYWAPRVLGFMRYRKMGMMRERSKIVVKSMRI